MTQPNQPQACERRSNIPRIVVDVLFRFMPPMEVLRRYFVPGRKQNPVLHPDKALAMAILKQVHDRSGDEIEALWEEAMQVARQDENEEEYKKTAGIFLFPKLLSEAMLVGKQECFWASNLGEVVGFEHYLRWKQTGYYLTHDLFTTLFKANCKNFRFEKLGFKDLLWPRVLHSDNLKVEELFEKKTADHHIHANALGPIFMPAWLALMNKPSSIAKSLRETGMLKERFMPGFQFKEETPPSNLVDLVTRAAYIRFLLFKAIKGNFTKLFSEYCELLKTSLNHPKRLHSHVHELHEAIERQLIGEDKPFPMVDYAWDLKPGDESDSGWQEYFTKLKEDKKNPPTEILFAGERAIMLAMNEVVFAEDNKLRNLIPLYYAYLLIKHQIRGEFLMLNNQIGFRNFLDYQERKDKVTDIFPFLGHLRQGLPTWHYLQDLSKIDLRFSPGGEKRNTPRKLGKNLDSRLQKLISPFSYSLGNSGNEEKVNFVAHFIKNQDKLPDNEGDRITQPRHSKLRAEVQKQAQNIMGLLAANTKTRLRGLDAASSEIRCRPEVFAQAFRFVRGEIMVYENKKKEEFEHCEILTKEWNEVKSIAKEFRFKHHCGEEFLSPIDGMRYIDETVRFMALQKGDHLGHCLAMGIDLQGWFRKKSHRMQVSRQERLDNLAWLIEKARELRVIIPGPLYTKLTEEWKKHFGFLYLGILDIKDPAAVSKSIRRYYSAMKFRGDNPYCYKRGDFDELWGWDKYKYLNEKAEGDDEKLMRAYHFSARAKEKGYETINVKVDQYFIDWLEIFQNRFCEHILKQGFHIETLPTCNVLLSSFKQYIKHPIFRFFPRENASKTNPWATVSISTDNPGLFITDLKAEYTLLACAMEKEEKLKEEYKIPFSGSWIDYLKTVKQIGNNEAPQPPNS